MRKERKREREKRGRREKQRYRERPRTQLDAASERGIQIETRERGEEEEKKKKKKKKERRMLKKVLKRHNGGGRGRENWPEVERGGWGGLEPLKKNKRASMRRIETHPGADKQTKRRSTSRGKRHRRKAG